MSTQNRLASSLGLGARVLQSHSSEPIPTPLLRQHIPSLFADRPHSSRSARYTQIPTSKVVEGLAAHGFRPFFAAQATPRPPKAPLVGGVPDPSWVAPESKLKFTKHVLRFRHESAFQDKEGANELVLLNSHGGESGGQLWGGFLRHLCLNRMIAGDRIAEIRVRHSGNIVEDFLEGAFHIVEQFPLIDESRQLMQDTHVSRHDALAFAKAALELRWPTPGPDPENPSAPVSSPAPVTPAQVIAARDSRKDQAPDTVWGVLGNAQRSLLQGGLQGQTPPRPGSRTRRVTTRPVGAIQEDIRLNRALWILAEALQAAQ